jgi:glycerol-3-phosphate dehydrogenase
VQEEMASTVTDVLRRRIPLSILGDQPLAVTQRIAGMLMESK